MRIFCLAMVALLLPFPRTSAQEKEKKITRADLPAAVEKTVNTESAGATIRGFSQETENGKVYYEAEMTVNGRSRDVLIDSNGAIVEVEEEVDLASLPSAVQEHLQAKSGGGKITKVESITKHGKLVAYEAAIDKNGKKTEIQVGPDGKSLAKEE